MVLCRHTNIVKFISIYFQSRIMRDMKRVNSQGIGKSMGFGFVNFKEHKHALQALRATNNNPDLFGENKVKPHN